MDAFLDQMFHRETLGNVPPLLGEILGEVLVKPGDMRVIDRIICCLVPERVELSLI